MKAFVLFFVAITIVVAEFNDFQELDELEEEINKALKLSKRIVEDAEIKDEGEGEGKKKKKENAMDLITKVDIKPENMKKMKGKEHGVDMLFTEEEENAYKMNHRPGEVIKRDLIPQTSSHWPVTKDGNGKDQVLVPFVFDSGTSQTIINVWQQAVEEYNQKTCIRFIPHTNEADFIKVINDAGCYSYVGKVGARSFPAGQPLSLQFRGLDRSGCHFTGIAIHEMMHALGYFHEQSRSDRDTYVTIVRENIDPNALSNFDKLNTNSQGTEYDFGSIMHYGRTAFSINGRDTIVPKSGFEDKPFGQRNELSTLDAFSLNQLYCKDRDASTTPTTSTSTQSTSTQGSTSTQSTSTQGSTSTQSTSTQGSTITQSTSTQGSTSTQSTSTQGSTSTQSTSTQSSTSTQAPSTTETSTTTQAPPTTTTTTQAPPTTTTTTTTQAPPTTKKPGINLSARFCKSAARVGFCRFCLVGDNCDSCKDKRTGCPRWAEAGYCKRRTRYRKWMRRNCAESCNDAFGGCI